MANRKITELNKILTSLDEDLLIIEQTNGTKAITKSNLLKEVNLELEDKVNFTIDNTNNLEIPLVDEKLDIVNNNYKNISSQLDNKATKTEVEVERNRIDLLTKIESGQTEGNTELLDIRNGADGKVYETAGASVRTQIKNLSEIYDDTENSYKKYDTGSSYIGIVSIHRIINKTYNTDIKINKLKFKLNASGYVEVYDYTIVGTEITNKVKIYSGTNTNFVLNPNYILKKGHYIGFTGTGSSQIFANSTPSSNGVLSAMTTTVSTTAYDLAVDIEFEPITVKSIYETLEGNKDEVEFNFNGLDYTNTTTDKTKAYVNEKNITGKITSLSCNMESSGYVSFCAYKLINNTFILQDIITVEKCSAGINEYEVNYYADDIMIGIYSENSNIRYSVNGAGYIVRNGLKQTTEYTRGNYCMSIGYTISTKEEKNTTKEMMLKKGVLVNSLNDENLVKYAYTGNIPNAVNSRIYYDKQCCISRYTISTTVKNLLSGNKIVIAQGHNTNSYTNNFYVEFDLANKKINIYKAWSGSIDNQPTEVLATKDITFDIAINETIRLIVKNDTVQKISAKLIREYSDESVELEYINTNRDNGHFGYSPYPCMIINRGVANGFEILDLKIYSNISPNNKLSIVGDSFVMGYNCVRYGDNVTDCYSYLIESKANEKVFISAMGGDDTINANNRVETDFEMVNSDYCLMEYGLNDDILSTGNYFDTKLRIMKFVNILRKNNVIPILVTYPRLKGDGFASSLNSWVRNYTNLMYLDVHKITAIDSTSDSSSPNTSLFYADGHPNKIANEKIANAFINQFDFIFN